MTVIHIKKDYCWHNIFLAAVKNINFNQLYGRKKGSLKILFAEPDFAELVEKIIFPYKNKLILIPQSEVSSHRICSGDVDFAATAKLFFSARIKMELANICARYAHKSMNADR